MPKDQPRSRELGLRAPSGEDARDGSDGATPPVTRHAEAAGGGRRGSCHGSEKDSGYSDGSDWQHERAGPSRADRNQDPGQQRAGIPSPIPGSQPSPICVTDDAVLKQPDVVQRRRQLPRGSASRVAGGSGGSGAAHVILLQPPGFFLTALRLHAPPSLRHSAAVATAAEGAHLPVLDSYHRIAPHPGKTPPDKATPREKSPGLSKRACTAHGSDRAAVTSSRPEQHLHKLPRLHVSASGTPCSSGPTGVSSTQGSSPGSGLCAASSFPSTGGLHRNNGASARHRRFLNNVELIRRSGLLDISLRTKELLRQSDAAERDVAQLRRHTELLCEAAGDAGRGPDGGAAAWERLRQSMAESGSYPGLLSSPVPPRHAVPPAQTERKPPGGGKSEASPPRFLTAIADPRRNCPAPPRSPSGQGRNRGRKSSKKGTFMPPDSSTG